MAVKGISGDGKVRVASMPVGGRPESILPSFKRRGLWDGNEGVIRTMYRFNRQLWLIPTEFRNQSQSSASLHNESFGCRLCLQCLRGFGG